LTGDPWQLGRISDAPADPEERQHWADAYDRGIETKLAQAGVLPSHPNYDDLYRQAVNGDYTHGVNGLEHGHELPMTRRDAILYAPEGTWREQAAQAERGNALLAEYARRNPDLVNEPGLHEAVDVTMEWYAERGERPLDNPSRFLTDVAGFHRSGVSPQHDHGRTSGIGSSGSPASNWEDSRNPMDDDQGMVGELRALQRARGW
jgi:hypothetical protein